MSRAQTPPCFTPDEFAQYAEDGAGWRAACRDCIREYQLLMLSENRCEPPDFSLTPLGRGYDAVDEPDPPEALRRSSRLEPVLLRSTGALR